MNLLQMGHYLVAVLELLSTERAIVAVRRVIAINVRVVIRQRVVEGNGI